MGSDIQNKLRIEQLNQEILRLQLDHRERDAEFSRQLQRNRGLLESAIKELDQVTVLRAASDGTVNWQPSTREGTLAGATEAIGYLLPPGQGETRIARLQLPGEGQGRIEVGHQVFLSLDAFPSREYGQVAGTLTSVAPVAEADRDGRYFRLATVSLPDTLLTSYGRAIPFQYNATGSARVITQDRTLLERLFDQFFNLLKNT